MSRSSKLRRLRFPAAALLCAVALSAHAQTNSTVPVVTIHAPDPSASESGDPGRFTLFRDGPTNAALNVYCVLDGTASNGVDYVTIPNWISVPAGVREVPIPVNPIDDTFIEGTEWVRLRLVYSPTMPPINYIIGSPSNAVVYILDNDPPPTNQPPAVHISMPTNGATFAAPANIYICAAATDSDGYVATVEFFAGSTSLGIRTNTCPACVGPANPFCLLWSNVPPGGYVLTALATDNLGARAHSDPVSLKVFPLASNAPPVVKIINPTNGSVFIAPVNIAIDATASDTDDDVVRVDFFAGDHFLGSDTGTNKNPYSIVWSNVPPGLYSLRARATDSRGAPGYAAPVSITVTGTNSPPPTNYPPFVTINAIDPIAAEGTNCWRWYTNTVGWTDACRTNYPRTNTATFLVRRGGPTNASLTVYYDVHGSASNGVDYATLPGVVTIPAGERSARIVVHPIDDAIPECNETVILRLLISSNSPPDYRVGWPAKAAAVIVDNDLPPPNTTLLCDGIFHLCVPAPINFCYHIECSLDMIHWVPVCTNIVTELGVLYAEPETADFPTRFYRVVPESNPPAQ